MSAVNLLRHTTPAPLSKRISMENSSVCSQKVRARGILLTPPLAGRQLPECVSAWFPSCSHFASARGRWEQLMASPKASLGPLISTSTPAAAKAKPDLPAAEQLPDSRMSILRPGSRAPVPLEWVQFLFSTSLGSVHAAYHEVRACVWFAHHRIP